MNYLVVDTTHGGIKIAVMLKKQNIENNVYVYDIYNTLDKNNKTILQGNSIETVNDIGTLKNIENLNIISPIHCKLQKEDYEKIINKKIKYYTHHDSVKLILKDWLKKVNRQNIPVIEITGVKGKTSTCFILKEVMDNPLILSSLGAYLFRDNKKITLQKNISITPANIIETINTVKKFTNPQCNLKDDGNIRRDDFPYGSCIFESSLGGCGIGDIGILTNIVENYPIAQGKSNAKEAKKQIFNCKNIISNYNTLIKYYPEFIKHENINTFAINRTDMEKLARDSELTVEDLPRPTVTGKNINYSLEKTTLTVEYNNLKTISNRKISGEFDAEIFAPGEYHVMNYLASITCLLTLEFSEDKIIKGIGKFKGLPGRTSLKKIENSTIIEEINPGINTSAIEKSVNLVIDNESYNIIIGGKYGITCEEIDENTAAEHIDKIIMENPSIKIIFTDELGKNILSKMKNNTCNCSNIIYIESLDESIDYSIKNNKDILLIYRSNYSQINKR